MGCGVSTLDAEDGPHLCHSNLLRRYKTVRPVTDNSMASEKLTDNGNGSSHESEDLKPLGDQEVKTKKVGSEGEKTREKWLDRVEGERGIHQNVGKEVVVVRVKVATEKEQGNNGELEQNEENEADTNDREDAFTGPGSPSFREYCIDNDSGNSNLRECSNEYDSGNCTQSLNEGGDDSTKRQNQPQKEGISISNKELEKKERKGRRFRSVLNRRKSSGKRNIFACYTFSHASFSENPTLKKVIGKAA